MMNFMKGIFLDTETNGLDWERHSILEIAFVICDLNSGKRIETFSSLIKPTEDEWARGDPISLEFTGITKSEVERGLEKARAQKEIITIFKSHGIERGSSLFICQNPAFDRLFFSKLIPVTLQENILLPYNWLDLASMYWAKQIEEGADLDQIGLSKDRIARHYKVPPEARPHRALNGVEHLLLCYERVVGFPSC